MVDQQRVKAPAGGLLAGQDGVRGIALMVTSTWELTQAARSTTIQASTIASDHYLAYA